MAFFRDMTMKIVAAMMIIPLPKRPITPKLILVIVFPKTRSRMISPITSATFWTVFTLNLLYSCSYSLKFILSRAVEASFFETRKNADILRQGKSFSRLTG
jgi:hypothetical protein